jgi:hypothetical protein
MGMTTNRSFGHARTQSPQAVHFSGMTTGSPTSLIRIASNVHATAQSPKPRQPQTQPFCPPATAAAALQVTSPR